MIDDVYQGRVLEVTEVRAGTETTQDYLAGAMVLSVYDTADFSEEGGQLEVEYPDGTTQVIVYNTVDIDQETITLGSALTYDLAMDSRVWLYPAAVEKAATVQLNNRDDTIDARVPQQFTASLEAMVREDYDEESVLVRMEGSDYIIYDVIAAPYSIAGEYVDVSTLPPTPTTDGVAPATAPTNVTTLGGKGLIFVKWTAPPNGDFLTYEVHVSTAGITWVPTAGDSTTLLETAATMIAARHLPDGTPFSYDTDYYFSIIPKDPDGVGPASTPESGQMDRNASEDLAAGSVTAAELTAVLALASTISTRSKDSSGTLTGAGTDITPDGIYSYRADGTTRFELPNSDLSPAQFKGQSEMDSVLAHQITIEQATMSESAVMTLQSSIQPPQNKPTATNGYTNLQFYNDNGWGSRAGWSTDGTYWYTYNRTYNTIDRYNNSGSLVGSSQVFSDVTYGTAHVGADGYIYTLWFYSKNNCWRIRKSKTGVGATAGASLGDLVAAWDIPTSGSGSILSTKWAPALGYDTVTGNILVAKCSGSDELWFYRYGEPVLGASQVLVVDYKSGGTVEGYMNVGCILRTNHSGADAGGDYYIFTNRDNADVYKAALVSTGARDSTRDWIHGFGTAKVGMCWDAATQKYYSMDQGGRRTRYEGGNMWWTTGSTTDTWQASCTWYNSTGPKQTTRSPLIAYAQRKRAQVLLQAGSSRPSGTTSARFYLRKNAADNNLGNSWYQGESTSTNPSLWVVNPTFSGTNDPLTSSFGSATPAKIKSQIMRQDGTPKVSIGGDGSGNFDGLIPPGCIQMFAGSAAPPGWLLCDGSAQSRTVYGDLYAALGGASSPYGQGDGSTTFNLPNLLNKMPRGGGTLGATGGSDTTTLTAAMLPPHTHTPADMRSAGGQGTQSRAMAGAGTSTLVTPIPTDSGPGTSAPVTVTNPYINLNFIIKT